MFKYDVIFHVITYYNHCGEFILLLWLFVSSIVVVDLYRSDA